MPMSEEMKRDFEEMLPGHHNHDHQLQQNHQYNHDEYLKAFAGYKSDERLKKQLKILAVSVFFVTLGLVVLVSYHRDVEKRMATHEPNLGPGATQAAPHHETSFGGLGGAHIAGPADPHSQMQAQLQAAQRQIPAAQMPYNTQFPAVNQVPAYGFNQGAMAPQAMPNGVYTVPLTRPGEMLPPCMVVPIQDSHGNYRVKRIVGR